MLKTLTASTLLLVSGVATAACHSLIQQQNDALKTAAQMFPSSNALFTVVICKEQNPTLFEVMYTQLHDRSQHAHSAPSGGLSKLKLPVDPNGRNRSTGLVLAEPNSQGDFTLKLRTRLSSGEGIDISKTVPLAQGQSSIFTDQGITVGFSRLPTR
ncbi:MAG: hypothetical protein ACFHVJ_11690 [Aestuariibacter sp.]